MAINKNAIIRYQALDKCFSNSGKMYFIEDLLEACNNALSELNPETTGIKRRQLYDDIRFMESEQGWFISLERHKFGNKTFFRYSDSKFSINNQPLNNIETEQIISALNILSRFKGMPQFEWINEIIPKIESNFNLQIGAKEIISFDSNEYLKGIDFLGELFNAILYKKVLQIRYKSFKSNKIEELAIHPYYLKQYNNRWFLFGLNPKFTNITNLSLDRIVDIIEIREKHIENFEIDFNEYFEDIIGVTKPENVEIMHIKLHFSIELAPYILTKPIHGSQKIVSNNNEGLIISIEVIPNYELERLILSFGDSVKIISPAFLKERILNLYKNAILNYESL